MNKIQKLRLRYKPTRIRCLLLAESPPKSKKDKPRFFYNPEVEKYDFLFRAVMGVLFPDFKKYRKGDKGKYLKRFKAAGFYLIDACDEPLNKLSEKERERRIRKGAGKKLKDISQLVSKQTPIFLIKKNIFEIFEPRLDVLGYRIANEFYLPFPAYGRQNKFMEWFRDDLEEHGLLPSE